MMSIKERYFEWLCNRVDCSIHYRDLLQELHNIKFTFTISLDSNRAIDGMILRDRFADEYHLRDYRELNRSCSVLEMLVALSIRCEKDIMDQMDNIDRTKIWFWDMIHNAGLDAYDNDHFDAASVDDIIDFILNRRYTFNGVGGFFPLEIASEDSREVEIWYQMLFWIQEKYPEINSIF